MSALACSLALSSWQFSGYWGVRDELVLNAAVVFAVLSPADLAPFRFFCPPR